MKKKKNFENSYIINKKVKLYENRVAHAHAINIF